MVLTSLRRALTPALILPDEQSWTVWGTDPASLGLVPVLEASAARRALVPRPLPGALAELVARRLEDLPAGAAHHEREVAALATLPTARPEHAKGHHVATHGEHHGHGEHEGHGDHEGHSDNEGHGDHEGHSDHSGHESHGSEHRGHAGHHGHDHGDMMAITGDPSADGLVMEPIEFSLGPIGTPLPGGLVADVVLDGDVVAESTVRATLRRGSGDGTPDLLAPVAWGVALDAATGALSPGSAWLRLVGIELERAVSHLAWTRALGRLLGWPTFVSRASNALEPVMQAQRVTQIGSFDAGGLQAFLADAADETERFAAFAAASRRLAFRLAHRGVVREDAARRAGLTGPSGRASGVQLDERTESPLYQALGFQPVVRTGGDALARTLVRLEEAAAAVRLARRAVDRAASGTPADAHVAVEGPRGPLHAHRAAAEWHLQAPGEQAALAVAGQVAVGHEWATALVVLASFDLSPWEVGS